MVRTETPSRSATCRLVRPSPTSVAISRSRSVIGRGVSSAPRAGVWTLPRVASRCARDDDSSAFARAPARSCSPAACAAASRARPRRRRSTRRGRSWWRRRWPSSVLPSPQVVPVLGQERARDRLQGRAPAAARAGTRACGGVWTEHSAPARRAACDVSGGDALAPHRALLALERGRGLGPRAPAPADEPRHRGPRARARAAARHQRVRPRLTRHGCSLR